jgi:hypothetical protein
MQHFGIAKEYEKNTETVSITYYCLMYIANEALKLQKEKEFVSNVLDYLEAVCINNSFFLKKREGCVLFRQNEIIQMMKSLDRWQLVKQLLKN